MIKARPAVEGVVLPDGGPEPGDAGTPGRNVYIGLRYDCK